MRHDRRKRRAAIFCNPKRIRGKRKSGSLSYGSAERRGHPNNSGVSSLDLRPGHVSPTGHFP